MKSQHLPRTASISTMNCVLCFSLRLIQFFHFFPLVLHHFLSIYQYFFRCQHCAKDTGFVCMDDGCCCLFCFYCSTANLTFSYSQIPQFLSFFCCSQNEPRMDKERTPSQPSSEMINGFWGWSFRLNGFSALRNCEESGSYFLCFSFYLRGFFRFF